METIELTKELQKWLLDPRDPALRAKVLVDLLDRPEDDPEVLDARSRIPQQLWVKATLKAFDSGAAWNEGSYQKYHGPSWLLAHLMAVGLPSDHPVFQQGAEYLIDQARPLSAMKGMETERFAGCDGYYWRHPIPCLTARMSMVLSHAGFAQHPVAKGARATCLHLFDPTVGFACRVIDFSLIPGCVMTVPEVMRGMMIVPEKDRTPKEKKFLVDATALLMKFGLYRYVPVESNRWREQTEKKTADWVRGEKEKWLKQGRADERKEKAGWLKFSFPLSYNSDLLEVLLVLGELGVKRNAIIDEGIERVLEARGKDGKWKLIGGLNGKMWANLDAKGKPSPWMTYRAMKAMKFHGAM